MRDWLVEHVRVRPGFRELVAEHDPLIVSSGFSELIEPILEREGVRARVVANHVAAGADGWRATFAEGPLCEVCGERCKRSAVAVARARSPTRATATPTAASRSPPSVRFARDGLAEWLDEQGVAYEPFDDLHDVRAALRVLQEDGAGDGRGG